MREHDDPGHLKPDEIRINETFSDVQRAYVEQKVNESLKDFPAREKVAEFLRVIAQTFGEETVFHNGNSTDVYHQMEIIDLKTQLIYSVHSESHTPRYVYSDLRIEALGTDLSILILTDDNRYPNPCVYIDQKRIDEKPRQRKIAARFLPEYAKDPNGVNKDIKLHCQRIWELVQEQYLKPPTK